MHESSGFIFVICQAGAEAALRAELLELKSADFGPLKLAFSRPGFVTVKVDPESPPPERFTLPSTLARAAGWSLGKVNGTDAVKMVDEICAHPFIADCTALHVFERETHVPGSGGFEPGISPLAAGVAELFAAHKQISKRDIMVNRRAGANARVADVIMVQPDEWWFGFHHALTRQSRWPGGVPALNTDEEHVSRAYLKLQEALLWSGIVIKPGDVCAEIGSSPGGACELLLEMGAEVIAIDPAELEPEIEEHKNLTYIRRRGHEVRKREFANVRWLLADLNMAPKYTLDTVRDIVAHESVNLAGLILTLKLDGWDSIPKVPEYIETVKKMGFQVVRARQLAFNRREFCLVGVKDKFALRVSKRKPKPVMPRLKKGELKARATLVQKPEEQKPQVQKPEEQKPEEKQLKAQSVPNKKADKKPKDKKSGKLKSKDDKQKDKKRKDKKPKDSKKNKDKTSKDKTNKAEEKKDKKKKK